ncbi:GntR family transcriptional regulator [Pseudarthrobacter sp. O4]|uniref:GntR family transcriptional regulator n=1 Tax=Pseudarthrobacter sp. O4 TaxID=3418417 RepID=UPI003CE8DEE1
MPRTHMQMTPIVTNAPSLTERAIEAVRDAIREGTLVPGELYSVYTLAENLGVSRSPVRDALLRLAETGVVRFERNRGFRVIMPGPEELVEIFAVRLALEVPAAGRAARAAVSDREALRAASAELQDAVDADDEALFMLRDQRLHGLILALAGNNLVRQTIENLRDAIRLVGASTAEKSRTLQGIHAEHTPIVQAILAGDGPGAAVAMAVHLRETGRLLTREAARQEGEGRDADALWAALID